MSILFNRLNDSEKAEIFESYLKNIPAGKLDEMAADYLLGKTRKVIVQAAKPSAVTVAGESVGTRALRRDSHLHRRIEILQKKYKTYGRIQKELKLYPGSLYLIRKGRIKNGKAVDAIVKATEGLL